MDDLVTWLLRVLDEDERNNSFESGDPYLDSRAAFMLADIEAKRAILALHGIIWRDIGWLQLDDGELVEASAELPVCQRCVPKHSSFRTWQDVPEGACKTVRLIASAYRERLGYRDEWRP